MDFKRIVRATDDELMVVVKVGRVFSRKIMTRLASRVLVPLNICNRKENMQKHDALFGLVQARKEMKYS